MGFRSRWSLLILSLILAVPLLNAAAKPHSVFLGSTKVVPYSIEGDPSGAQLEETRLHVRPLLVDGRVKEWTTGESHDITDRSFVVRRAMRVNDALPGEKGPRWVWQRGPWLLVDRVKGSTTALRLPDYEPTVSEVVWFRDFAAYCGLSSNGKQLYAVVAQVAARRPILAKRLSAWLPGEKHNGPACASALWQREPLRVTFEPAGAAAVSYDLVGLSAVLVEDGNSGDDPGAGSTGQ